MRTSLAETWPGFDTKTAGRRISLSPKYNCWDSILANVETLRSIVTDKQIVIFAEVFGVPVGDLFPPK
jgi:hypothetical protein